MIDSFNPFTDRLARDIRNSLSKAFGRSVVNADPSAIDQCIDHWRHRSIAPACIAYIQDRRRRYTHILEKIQTDGVRDGFQQSLLIWNQGLWFEFHEIAEGLWRKTTEENRRQALKGMIMAAGVYEHLAYKQTASARRLAEKAADLLMRYGNEIRFIANADELIFALQRIDPAPPRLVPS